MLFRSAGDASFWATTVADGQTAAARAAAESGVVRGAAVAPVSVSANAAGNRVFDFGRHAFGWVEVNVERPGAYEFVVGELIDESGSVQTNALYTWKQGNVRCAHVKGVFGKTGWTRIPFVEGGVSRFNAHDAGRFGIVMPFRWLEVASAPFELTSKNVRQVPIYYPYDMSASSF